MNKVCKNIKRCNECAQNHRIIECRISNDQLKCVKHDESHSTWFFQRSIRTKEKNIKWNMKKSIYLTHRNLKRIQRHDVWQSTSINIINEIFIVNAQKDKELIERHTNKHSIRFHLDESENQRADQFVFDVIRSHREKNSIIEINVFVVDKNAINQRSANKELTERRECVDHVKRFFIAKKS
jgi:hypothetical protein